LDYKEIICEKSNGIVRITLNRPEKLNALSIQLRKELVDVVKSSEADPEVRVIVIKGAGRAFSAGYDITPPQPVRGNIRQDIDRLFTEVVNTWNVLWNCRKFVISQVHGYCIAGGTDLVLNTDMIVCADDAQFGFPAGRAMGTLATHMWTYLIGPQWAKYMLATGNSIDGKTAERIGLAWKSVPSDKLEAEVTSLAETLAKVPYGLLVAHKRIVNIVMEMMGRGLVQQLAAEGDAIAHLEPSVLEFDKIANERGLKVALEWRDSAFGDYRAQEK
jgi:enoyl-CoA hydratase